MKGTSFSEGQPPAEKELPAAPKSTRAQQGVSIVAWFLAFCLVGIAVYLGYQKALARSAQPAEVPARVEIPTTSAEPTVAVPVDNSNAVMPDFNPLAEDNAVTRRSLLHTTIPDRSDEQVQTYVVDLGDSVFEISHKFKITPETVLWANYKQLNDNPDMISRGMSLKIPPVNGVLYDWQANDSLQSVASRFQAKADDILNWPGNNLDLVNPVIKAGMQILIPGGRRELRQWVIPTIPRGPAGVMQSVLGPGACPGGYSGANGSGSFIWPAPSHKLSGNDYGPSHLGIDIAAMEGTPIAAADAGVVVFAGWANGGYGNMVMIDHGNGYQTVYGHLSSIATGCGASVGKGSIIGHAGSTGNSTGAHLHFEVRYNGGFINPWSVLP